MMNKKTLIFFLAMGFILALRSYAETITTRDGTTYENATVRRVEPDGITVMWPGGIVKIPVENLPQEILAEHGLSFDGANNYRRTTRDKIAESARAERARSQIIEGRRLVEGKVFQIMDGGILIRCEPPRTYGPIPNRMSSVGGMMGGERPLPEAPKAPRATGIILLLGHPREAMLVNGQPVKIIAFPAGRHTYRTAAGATNTVARFATSPEMAMQYFAEP